MGWQSRDCTGASSGIGEAIAEALVKHGLQVVALARRKDRLEELKKRVSGEKGKLFPIQKDISKEEDILNAFKWIKQNLGPIHVLINNAGILRSGNITDGDTQDWEATFKVNVIGLSIATREAIKYMNANNVDGHIIHMNSIAGHKVHDLAGVSVYPASKYAVTALAETLRLELNRSKSKIKITSLSPGPVDTEILPTAFKEDPKFKEIIETAILSSEDIADATIYVLSTPPRVQIQELTIRPVTDGF